MFQHSSFLDTNFNFFINQQKYNIGLEKISQSVKFLFFIEYVYKYCMSAWLLL